MSMDLDRNLSSRSIDTDNGIDCWDQKAVERRVAWKLSDQIGIS
jgi:hypothetical protein